MRFGLTARVLVLAAVLLLTLWLALIAAVYWNLDLARTAGPPAPAQLAAIADLLAPLGSRDREAALAALRSSQLKAWLTDLGQVPQTGMAQGDVVEADRTALGPRLLAVEQHTDGSGIWPRSFTRPVGTEIVWISLGGADVLALEAVMPLIVTRLGLPVGLLAGLVGTVAACIALLLLHREIRPLAQLAAAADRIDPMGEPVMLPAVRARTPEVEMLVRAFARLQTRIHAMTRARLALISGIQHDVRSFATRLRLRIEQVPDAVERERAIADIGDMIELLDNALLAARAGVGALDEEMLDLDNLLRAEVTELRRAGQPVELDAGQTDGPIWVLADRVALRRVIGNVVDNAVKYGRHARVSLAASGGAARLEVTDAGPGFAPGMADMLLEPFTRAEPSRARGTGGAGLGLAVARSLLEAHGGTICLGTGPGGGGRVRITLPLFAPR